MATLIARITKDKVQAGALAKLLERQYGEGCVTVSKESRPARSRAERLAVAEGQVDEAKTEVEALRDELQEWYDNLPEAFQNGSKGEALKEAIDQLESISSALEECDWSVEFPGMYG